MTPARTPSPPPMPATRAAPAVSEADLIGWRRAQQLAYDCAEAVAATLEVGVTERQAAAAMRRWLTDQGVGAWFHLPFAWFGDRTALRGVRVPSQFFPTNRALATGMPFILDCAPIVDGYPADIGFTASLGANPALDRVLDDLAGYRALILDQVRAGASQRQVYQAVDQLAADQGYQARHRAYPFRVIAHQVWRQPVTPGRTALGFGVASSRTLLRSLVVGAANGRSPLWNAGHGSDQPPAPGLWAVEPHLGREDTGAKFEELLVVAEDDAYWLDDDLPHVRRWRQRGRR